MKKIKFASVLLSGLLALLIVPFAAAGVRASADEGDPAAVNLFAEEGGWKHNKSGSLNPDCVVMENGKISVTPRSTVGSTYVNKAMGQGRISFTYKITPNEYYDMTTEAGRAEWMDNIHQAAQVFFGVTFLNAPKGAKPSGVLAVPFNEGKGGFPYMVAFDSEKQNKGGDPVRARQLGLSVRRYKYDGSHDYTRWSSVEPTDATYINSNGVEYQSKIPDFAKAVTLEDCFDNKEHSVDIDVKNLYTEKGDAADAVQLEVYFDGELSLRVIDQMPFENDSDSGDEFIDKRKSDGYISIYAHGGTQDIANDDEEYTVTFTSFSAIFRESNGGVENTDGGKKKKGCSSRLGAADLALPACVLLLGAAVTVLAAKGKKGKEEL